jgi:ribosomal protein S20
MDPNRKLWNDGHQKLNRALAAGEREKAIELFLKQHAMVHSGKMAKSGLWSFEDEILSELTNDQIRIIPAGGEHSIAWILLHIARIEDITMNMLVAGTAQLFIRDGWAKKMNVDIVHSANKMDDESVARLRANIDVSALKAYRIAVGRRTREIVKKIRADTFKQKVDPTRMQKVMNEGAVAKEAVEIINYWSTRTIAGLLLMPATRHNILHLNEALRIKQRL